ncbi:MAG: FlgD immunoglobulin-like domain containing protein [Salinibacter sp.]
MLRVGLLMLLIGLVAPNGQAQPGPSPPRARALAPLPDLVSNDVRVLAAAGDSLWSGPLLTLYLEPTDRSPSGPRLLVADAPALTEEDNVVASIAARNTRPRSLVWAGLTFDTGGGEPGAGGFLVSTDGGESFARRAPQLDAPGDTTVQYGGTIVPAVPVTQQAGSTPRALAFGPDADTTWVAGLRSGIRWSADGGQSWTRAVLPPDTSRTIDPRTETSILLAPPLDDGRGSLNHLGYSVLVDETGTVWAGTGRGVNRSRRGSVTPRGHRGWRRFAAADPGQGPPGSVVVSLAEQPRPDGRNPVWMAAWASRQQGPGLQRFGVAVTPNGGATFRATLIGERVYDLAARRTRVYAAAESGLFVSADQGRTWRSVKRFPLRGKEVLPSPLTTRAVATTEAALWVGTPEGLLRLDRSAEGRLLHDNPEWQLLRAETPVNPEQPSEQVPDVATYAYPNPFVPSRDDLVRIVYELDTPRTVTVNIYDFGMNRVRTITEQKPAGQQETVWRGRDAQGLRVPTGTYVYTVDLGDRTVDGKIVVAN